ncbi:MAG: hypothetical protein ACRDQB_10315 [Thermocrispum sp.]
MALLAVGLVLAAVVLPPLAVVLAACVFVPCAVAATVLWAGHQ